MSILGVWPDIKAPLQYRDAPPGWFDPELPNFRLIWDTARDCGYAVGIHGSLKRDVDLIATPWVDNALEASDLIQALCIALNAKQVGCNEQKPHGRIALTLQLDGWFKPIDLSILPRLNL